MITQPTLINGKIELTDGKGVTSMVQEYSNILVPLDGSQQAEIALDKAVAVAKRNEAHIDVLAVIDPGQFGYNLAGLADGDITYQLVQDSEAYLKETVDQVKRMALRTLPSTFEWEVRNQLFHRTSSRIIIMT